MAGWFYLRGGDYQNASTAYHPEGNKQTEDLQNTFKSMLKTSVQDDP